MNLGFDTSSKRGSVAIVDGRIILDEIRAEAPASFSRELLKMTDSLLLRNALSIKDLCAPGSAISACTGPGTFTGIRIGLATVEGIALSLKIPVHGVGTLESMAWSAALETSGKAVMAVDAGKGNAYWAVFNIEDGRPRRETPDDFGPINEIVEKGLPLFVDDADPAFGENARTLRHSIAAGAAFGGRDGEAVSAPGGLTPNYILKSSAERTVNRFKEG